jgi:hypothetical protein
VFIEVLEEDTRSKNDLLAPINGLVELHIAFYNPKGNALTNVVITTTLDARLTVERVLSYSTGQLNVSGNTITLSGFTLQPGQQGSLVVRVRVNSRAKIGDKISTVATLESPDASIHPSNLLNILVIGDSLPATGQIPVWRGWVWIALLALIGGLLLGWGQRARVWRRS